MGTGNRTQFQPHTPCSDLLRTSNRFLARFLITVSHELFETNVQCLQFGIKFFYCAKAGFLLPKWEAVTLTISLCLESVFTSLITLKYICFRNKANVIANSYNFINNRCCEGQYAQISQDFMILKVYLIFFGNKVHAFQIILMAYIESSFP